MWAALAVVLVGLLLAACGGHGDPAADVEARLARLNLTERAALLIAVPVDLDSVGTAGVGASVSDAGATVLRPGAVWIERGSLEGLAAMRHALPPSWQPIVIASADRGLGGTLDGATVLPRLHDLARAGWGSEELRRAGRVVAGESDLLGITLPIVGSPPLLHNPDPYFLARDSTALDDRYRAIFTGAREGGRPAGLALYWSPDPARTESTWDRSRLELMEGAAGSGAIAGGASAIVLGPLRVPALDPLGRAAAYSEPIIGGTIRRDADFHRLVIADLRETATAADPADEIVAALMAGADLVATRLDLRTAAGAIADAVTNGRLPAERISEAARRVLTHSPAPSGVDTTSAATLRRRLADESTLRLRDEAFRFIGEFGIEAAWASRLAGSSGEAGGPVQPADSLGFSPSGLAAIDRAMDEALADSVMTAGAVLVIRNGVVVFARGYGKSSDGSDVSVSSTIFDLASLTKVVGTTTAAAILVDRGRLALDAPVRRYLPEFRGDGKEDVTIRHLLTHTSGLPSGLWVYGSAASAEQALGEILNQRLVGKPGQRVVYSDLGYILLAEVVERVTGTTIDRFLAAELFVPLGMAATMYRPPSSLYGRIVPTADRNERPYPLTGVVHDANSFRLGGVAGHAGIFSTAADVGRFARMMLGGGEVDGVRILSDSVVSMFRTKQPGADERALGWDTPAAVSSAGRYASANTYGHTGYTGTSLWIDPDYRLAIVLLTNRTYPGGSSGEILELRTAVQEAVYQAITDREVPRRRGAR